MIPTHESCVCVMTCPLSAHNHPPPPPSMSAARLLRCAGSPSLRRAALLCGGGAGALGLWSASTRPALCESTKTAPKPAAPSLEKRCLAEAFGTAIIIQGGCGAGEATASRTGQASNILGPATNFPRLRVSRLSIVCALKYAGANYGTFGLAAIWGVSVALAAYSTRAISGAHLNPAVTSACVVNGLFPIEEAPACARQPTCMPPNCLPPPPH